jgi:hypothetical protein
VYPIASKATYAMRDTKGEPSGTIEVNVADWTASKIVVREKGGKVVESNPARHALDFLVEPGKSYVVTDAQ